MRAAHVAVADSFMISAVGYRAPTWRGAEGLSHGPSVPSGRASGLQLPTPVSCKAGPGCAPCEGRAPCHPVPPARMRPTTQTPAAGLPEQQLLSPLEQGAGPFKEAQERAELAWSPIHLWGVGAKGDRMGAGKRSAALGPGGAKSTWEN